METLPTLTVAGIRPMLTVAEVAALIHKTPWVVNKLARLKKIPGGIRVGREWQFRRNDVQRFVEGR